VQPEVREVGVGALIEVAQRNEHRILGLALEFT
jgi:hypothetical protein